MSIEASLTKATVADPAPASLAVASIGTLYVHLANDLSDMRLFIKRGLAFVGHGHKSPEPHGQHSSVQYASIRDWAMLLFLINFNGSLTERQAGGPNRNVV